MSELDIGGARPVDRREVVVGVFMILLFLAFIGAVLSMSEALEPGPAMRPAVARFRSLGLLAKNATVKFKGIDIGTVTKIEIDPDPALTKERGPLTKVSMLVRRDFICPDTAAATIIEENIMGNLAIEIVENQTVSDSTKWVLGAAKSRVEGDTLILNSLDPVFWDDIFSQAALGARKVSPLLDSYILYAADIRKMTSGLDAQGDSLGVQLSGYEKQVNDFADAAPTAEGSARIHASIANIRKMLADARPQIDSFRDRMENSEDSFAITVSNLEAFTRKWNETVRTMAPAPWKWRDGMMGK